MISKKRDKDTHNKMQNELDQLQKLEQNNLDNCEKIK